MANFYRITTALIAVFFTSQIGAAITHSNPNPTPDPYDELFDYYYGKAAEEVIELAVPNCNGQGPKLKSECFTIMEAHVDQLIANYGDGISVRMTDRGPFVRSEPNNQISVSKPTWIEYWGENLDPKRWYAHAQSNRSTANATSQTTVYVCPPAAWPDYIVSAYIGAALFCFDPLELKSRDSCPNSPSDPDYMLPITDTSSTSFCRQKSDGSVCAYTANNLALVADFEYDCYGNPDPEYAPPTSEPPDPNNGCSRLGTGDLLLYSCPQDPNQTCTASPDGALVCPSSCGYMDLTNSGSSEFVCLTNDPSTGTTVPTDPTDPTVPIDPIVPTVPTDPPNETEKQELESLNKTAKDQLVKLDAISSGVSSITGAVQGLKSEVVKGNSTLTGIKTQIGIGNVKLDELKTIGNEGNGLLKNIDDTLNAPSTFSGVQPSNFLVGFYEPVYVNGFADVWTLNEAGFNNSSVKAFIDSWKITVGGSYSLPEFCVNLGFANYGCHGFDIDPRVYPFIRILLILSALILARQITLGA